MRQHYYVGVFSVEGRCFCWRVLASTIQEASVKLKKHIIDDAVLLGLFEATIDAETSSA